MNITLIGYRGTGKTTLARLIAERLKWSWVDADVELEARAGKTIREVFETEGEGAFRELEVRVVRDLAARDRTVVAVGGGAVMRPENRTAIRESGTTIWLVASPETILSRIEADTTTNARRPNLTTLGGLDEIRKVLAEREPLYRDCADLTVNTESGRPDSIADQIVTALRTPEHTSNSLDT